LTFFPLLLYNQCMLPCCLTGLKKVFSVILIVFLFSFIIKPTYAVETTQTNPIVELLNIFLHFGQGGSSTQNPSPEQIGPSLTPDPLLTLTPNPNLTPNITPPISSGKKVYYSQCNDGLGGGYGNLPLDGPCALCNAGCGPTTVAMIAASYLGPSYNPKTILDIYRSKKYPVTCSGSSHESAIGVFKQIGIETTDPIFLNKGKASTVVPRLREYLNAGWTFFTGAWFCTKNGSTNCGHYFWITDIDSQGNIWAYDAYYGRFKLPPLNQNSRSPYPLYQVAIGVKKL